MVQMNPAPSGIAKAEGSKGVAKEEAKKVEKPKAAPKKVEPAPPPSPTIKFQDVSAAIVDAIVDTHKKAGVDPKWPSVCQALHHAMNVVPRHWGQIRDRCKPD